MPSLTVLDAIHSVYPFLAEPLSLRDQKVLNDAQKRRPRVEIVRGQDVIHDGETRGVKHERRVRSIEEPWEPATPWTGKDKEYEREGREEGGGGGREGVK